MKTTSVGAAERYYGPISAADLRHLRDLATQEREDFFARRPRWRPPYYDRLVAACLCQGAALHFVHGERGVKDLGVYLFYARNPSVAFPSRGARWARESNLAHMGVYPMDAQEGYRTRRVDIFNRTIPYDLLAGRETDSAAAVRAYLSARRTRTARELARKAVV